MKDGQRVICQKLRLQICLLITFLLFVTAGLLLWRKLEILAYLALAGGILFLAYSIWVGGNYLKINDQGVRRMCFLKCKKELQWNEVKELLLIGIQRNDRSPMNRFRVRFVCISTELMNEEEMYTLFCSWPKNSLPYFQYDETILQSIEEKWNGNIKFYNFS